MDLGLLVIVSCVLTSISMFVIVAFLLYLARYGGQGVRNLIDRFLGGDEERATPIQPQRRRGQQAAVASSQTLRARARNLDFPAPGQQDAGQFGAQVAGQQAVGNAYPDFPPPNYQQQQQPSLRARGGQYPEFNPQAANNDPHQGFQPSTPSLSPSRPFQAGTQFRPSQGQQPQQGQFRQQQQFGTQSQAQFGQQQGHNPNQGQQPQQGQFRQQQQFGAQSQAQFGQQQQRLNPNQGQQPQQGQFGQQPQPLGGVGQNRPPLRSRPRPDGTVDNRPLGGRDRRQSDDYDRIYDDRGAGGDNFVDDVGDFIDNF